MPFPTYYLSHLKKHVRLGRIKPRVRPLTLHLQNYLLNHLSPPPASVDYTQKVTSWPMYLNDQLGDCVIAGGGHEIGCWTANESGSEVTFTDGQITSLYSAIGGYVPGDESTDNGCMITDMLNFWQSSGYPGSHTIAGYAAVNTSNQQELQLACYLFGTVTLGAILPDSWLDDPQPGFVWDVGKPNPQHGHCVPVVGYNAQGVQIVSWGMVGTITWAAVTNAGIVDEAYAKVSPDWATGQNQAPSGLNMAELQADLQMVSAGSDFTSTAAPNGKSRQNGRSRGQKSDVPKRRVRVK